MEKKMVLLVGCLVVMLLCGMPQMVSAYDQRDGYDEELVVDSEGEEPEYDDDEEYDENEDTEEDDGNEDYDDEKEDYGERY